MLERCIICLWAIWRARNDLVFNGVLDRPTDIALKLNSFLKLYYRSALNRKNTPWFHGSIHQGGNFQNKVGLNWIVMHLITRMQLGLALFLEILQGTVIKSGAGPIQNVNKFWNNLNLQKGIYQGWELCLGHCSNAQEEWEPCKYCTVLVDLML